MSEETFRVVVTIGVGIATLCILVMAGAAVGLAIIASNLKKKFESVMTKVEPIIDTAKRIAQQNESKVSDIADRAREIAASGRDIAARGTEIAANAKVVSDQAKDIAIVAKDQAHIFAEVGRDIADRTKAHVARVDSAVDETVDQARYAGEHLRQAALKPVREANAIFAGLKAAIGTMARGRVPSADHVTQDEEMFI